LVPYKNIEIHLQNNPGEPDEEYRTPSALYYVDENGIHFATRNMRKFLGIPGNARKCYQCEYDEYIWKKVESGELPKTQSRFYNWAVWNAYREYRLQELQESFPLIINCEQGGDTNDKKSISSVTDDAETA
jgi:hypothetical protein